MGWAGFWAIFSGAHLVTLIVYWKAIAFFYLSSLDKVRVSPFFLNFSSSRKKPIGGSFHLQLLSHWTIPVT
jgi:hypothetical protein